MIYELHVGSLNPANQAPGTFADAIALLPYFEDLGVNAIELMPMLQFDGSVSWGTTRRTSSRSSPPLAGATG